MPAISYLITVHNEDQTLEHLLAVVAGLMDSEDEIIILDDFSDNPKTLEVFKIFEAKIKVHQHRLDRNYGAHKNYGNSLCKNEWIFQLDGDENPSEILIINIKDIIQQNPTIELFLVPRINDFKGVLPEHARQWGWRLTPSPICNNRPIVNWPDYQGRIYRNNPKIRWDRRLHEKIEGFMTFAPLPADEELALYHDKTIETQLNTNKRYNEWFTAEENQGHAGFSQTGSK